jgi:hypothetical protein
MDDHVRRRIEAGVTLRAIRCRQTDVHPNWPDSAEDLRELRRPPKGSVFAMTTYIYDEKVALISTRRENFAMTIESAEFAQMQRALFEVLWSVSAPGAAAGRALSNGRLDAAKQKGTQ